MSAMNVHEAAIDLYNQVNNTSDVIGRLEYGATAFACGYCEEHKCVEFMFGPRGEPAILSGSVHSADELEKVIQAIVTMENIAFDMIQKQGISVSGLTFNLKLVSAA